MAVVRGDSLVKTEEIEPPIFFCVCSPFGGTIVTHETPIAGKKHLCQPFGNEPCRKPEDFRTRSHEQKDSKGTGSSDLLSSGNKSPANRQFAFVSLHSG